MERCAPRRDVTQKRIEIEKGAAGEYSLPATIIVYRTGGLAAIPRSWRMNAALDLNLREKGVVKCVKMLIMRW